MSPVRGLRSWLGSRRFKLVFVIVFLFFLGSRWLHWSSDELQSSKNIKVSEVKPIESGNRKSAFLVVLIMTGPKNADRRGAMRETWLSTQSKASLTEEVPHYFVIGTKNLASVARDVLSEEQRQYDDLLLLDQFEDSYNKLTEKLALMLEWLHEHFIYKYVLKADDDTFARLDIVTYDLKFHPEKAGVKNLYWGYFYGKGNVKHSGPWTERNWKLCDHYLPYARGGGYVLSQELVAFVAKNWRQFELYNSEDVSMGAWLAPLKLSRVHDIRFDTEYKSRGCKNVFIVTHKQSIQDMKTKFKNLEDTETLCSEEFSNINGYIYNWMGYPSQCCVRQENIP